VPKAFVSDPDVNRLNHRWYVVVENEGRALGAEVGELKNFKE
jgi:hypothetical protein